MRLTCALLLILAFATSSRADVTENWYPLPAATNRFATDYRDYSRMLWAFDYGHGLTYEKMLRNAKLGRYDFVSIEGPLPAPFKSIVERIKGILASPPQQQPAEEAVYPAFAAEFPWLRDLFSWSHKLHAVTYDVLATEPPARARLIVDQQLAVYRRLTALSLPTVCKNMMVFMEGQPFSMRFRRSAPQANGLIWSYHFYQLSLYEGLLSPAGPERDARLAETMRKFKLMAQDPVSRVPEMPMTRQVAPEFYKQYRDLAAIFDNLHELHDVIGDLLAADDEVYGGIERKKTELNRVLREVLDDTTHVIDCDLNGHGE